LFGNALYLHVVALVQRKIMFNMGKKRCKLEGMPRQARLDAPRVLHHVMGRKIEGISIFGGMRAEKVS
jgi:hypothetical protein